MLMRYNTNHKLAETGGFLVILRHKVLYPGLPHIKKTDNMADNMAI